MDTINSRAQFGAAGGAGLDPVKINQIFEKIVHSNNLEIEERNLKNLAQKISLKLIDCGYLVANHGAQVQRLFEWLGNRAASLFQGGMGPPGTVCSIQAVQNFCSIFAALSQSMEGRALILQSGGKELFNDLMNCPPLQVEAQILQIIEAIMKSLIEHGGDGGQVQPRSGLGFTGAFQQPGQVQGNHLQAQTQDLERELSATNEVIDGAQTQNRFQEDMRSEFTGLQHSTIGGFSRRDFSLNQPSQALPKGFNPQASAHQSSMMNSQFQAQSQHQMASQANQSYVTGQSHQAFGQSQMSASKIQAVMLQSGINQSHMEIMHKQQVLKEECELPQVVLSDEDEKHLFDLSVALKFGNPQTVLQSCQKLQYQYFNDFPPEVFLQRMDILKALLDLLEGSSGAQAQSQNYAQSGNEWDLTQLAQSCLLTFVKKLKNLYRFLLNNGCKPNVMQKDAFDLPEADNGSKSQSHQFVENYIERTYPSNRLSRWETTLEGLQSQSKYGGNQRSKSYGATNKQPQGGHNTLSCKALLGLILTKSIYLLQDTEKIGLFVQLIQESLEALNFIYNVGRNPEFSEFLHLCLFAFDKVCDFYREQLYDEVLIQPVLTLLLKFVNLLNTIQPQAVGPSSGLSSQSVDRASDKASSMASTQRTLASRFKAPFTETLFKNTENVQRTLRRALFRYQFSEETDSDKYKTILKFFERLENSQEIGDSANLLQRNVQKSFFKAQNCFAKFVRVTDFRVDVDQMSSGNMDQFCFVRAQDQHHQALTILQDLSECIEMKMDFPFEHLIIDCIYFAGLTEESGQEGGSASRIQDLEKLVQTYMAIPIAEIRERILRRIYQKLRLPPNQNTVQDYQRPKALTNNLYLARFILRKGMLNHFVNGILINHDIAQNEESKLQMSLGQLIIKIIILSFNEIQSNVSSKQGGQQSNLVQTLSQFLLTFQCLLPQYSDLISLIELIEEGGQKNCRYIRILRDLFSTVDHKREFATNVLRSSFSQDCQDDHIKDMLKSCIDLRQPSLRVAQNLELVNSNYDFTTFGIQDITNILMTNQSGSGGQQDYAIKRSSLEQLTMVLFDVQNKRGRFLFSQSEAIQDVFTYVLEEILLAQNTSKNALKGKVSNLGKDQVLFVNECIRFMFYSYIFFNDEPIVQGFFNKVKGITTTKKGQTESENTGFGQVSQFEQLLNALVYFMGSVILRENCILLLYVQTYQQLWICTKVQKMQAPSGQLMRNLTILIPDFCQESIYQLIPYTMQAIRMPAKDDLILTDEQKMYIEYRYQNNQKLNDEYQQLEHVAVEFTQSIAKMRAQDYRQVLKTGVDLWKNYLTCIEAMKDPLVNPNTLSSLIELLKILPTRDYEYYDLADLLNVLQQILSSHERMLNIPGEQLRHESQSNFEDFLVRLMDALKYHLMPYLEETGISGMADGAGAESSDLTPKSYLIYRYLQLLEAMILSDAARKKPSALILLQHLSSSSFLTYLMTLYQFYKNNFVMKRLLLSLFWLIILHYRPSDAQIVNELCDTLVDQVSSIKMVFNQFEQSSIVMWSLRIMIVLSQRRQLRINQSMPIDQERMPGLSETYVSKIEKFKSFGWIMRFAESRDARIRVLTWDLLTEVFDYEFLRSHPSVIHQSINSFLKNNELYCVKISVLKFLNKVCDALMKNCECPDDDNSDLDQVYDRPQSDQIEQMTVQTLLQTLNRQGLISQIHKILSQKDCPLLFLTLTLQLLHNLTQMDYRKAIPVLTQLDYWTFLVELLDINALIQIEKQESREILRDMRGENIQGKEEDAPGLLNFPDPCQCLDMVYMALNSILDFLFEAFKRDSQLAALLVKTTKLMQSVFYLIQHTLEKYRQDRQNQSQTLRLKNKGLLTVFIDKIIKILHVAMLHPQDYSVDLISKFIFEQPISSSDGIQKLPRNWLYFIEMFQIIETFNQTLGFTDIKLALIRFISEFLIQTAHFENNYLDELLNLNGDLITQQEGPQFIYQNEMNTYGSMLFIEFAKVFKHLYIDQRSQNYLEDSENQKKDITLCLEILFSSCQSAKALAVDQNFLKKVIDICQENASAVYLSELQKYSHSKSAKSNVSQGQRMFEQQLHRQFKYVSDANDIDLCEREATRMLQLVRNLFFDSQNLLLAFVTSQNPDVNIYSRIDSAQGARNMKKPSAKKDAFASQSEKLLNLFGQILEELGSQKQFEQLICECLMTMITFAGQNIKFKNLFMQPINVSTQSKRITLLKLVSDKIHTFGNLQSNSRLLRLLYTLLRSLSISPDVAKDIMKMKFIEEIIGKITPQVKNDKDIKLCKYYLGHFMAFMSAFTSTEEGSKQILKIKQSFEMPLFILDTVSIPTVQESSVSQGEFAMSPINQLVAQILLFIRNATIDSRQNKVHFLKNDDFLPCLMAFLSAPNQHPKIKAYTAAVLWSLVHNHQGIKAAINRSAVISELQLMKSEYQRTVDKESYMGYIGPNGQKPPPDEGQNYEYHANYTLADSPKKISENKVMVKDMNAFILKALTGILTLIQS